MNEEQGRRVRLVRLQREVVYPTEQQLDGALKVLRPLVTILWVTALVLIFSLQSRLF